MNLLDARRCAPRISVDGLCGVVIDDDLRHASMTNLSTLGLRLERPFDPKTAKPVVQLEIELPGLDEIVWASAAVTHAYLTPMPGRTADGQPRFWCRAGLRIANASQRERRLLRDYVIERLVERSAAPADRRSLRSDRRGQSSR
ncbi:MAG TPA: PilZ domain-containing protein [Kofleriaceae bacterium]